MLDNVGLIHMNGRVYDPTLARFLSVDPINQAPDNAQSYNPYSYVFNSPMMLTDPSGFSAWTKYRRPVVGIAASVLTYGMATYAATGVWFADGVANVGLAKFGASVLAGGVGGGIQSGTVEGALKGAVMAAAFYGVGSGAEQIASAGGAQNAIAARTFQVAGHAAVACAGAVASGGQCGPAALAQGFTSGVSPYLPSDYVGGTIAHAGVGALAAKWTGADAREGAFTAAYSYLFNYCAHASCWNAMVKGMGQGVLSYFKGVGYDLPKHALEVNGAFGVERQNMAIEGERVVVEAVKLVAENPSQALKVACMACMKLTPEQESNLQGRLGARMATAGIVSTISGPVGASASVGAITGNLLSGGVYVRDQAAVLRAILFGNN